MVTGIRIHQDKRVRATFQRGAGDKPRSQQRLPDARLRAAIDQVQTGTVAVERGQVAGQQVLVPCRRGLRDDDLAVADAEVGQLEAVRVERAFARFHGRVVEGPDPGQHVYRQPRSEQSGE